MVYFQVGGRAWIWLVDLSAGSLASVGGGRWGPQISASVAGLPGCMSKDPGYTAVLGSELRGILFVAWT